VSDQLDPITFEVVRHRLWAINDEQARMAARLSGSPAIYEIYDFNAALVTGDGRGLFTGVYIMHHGATIDEFVRIVLDTWPLDDIHEGDMFFTNDPWWGALHANDGILAMPIFWEGELVIWSAIVMHDNDVGGPVPGSFVVGAKDRFGEAPLFPPMKIASRFRVRTDVERAYLRNSRTPEFNALNMRARMAALKVCNERVRELVAEYGIETFRACQEGILSYVSRVVRQRLESIPDGSWSSEVYHDHDGTHDHVYRLQCQMTKTGHRLVFDMTGCEPQAEGPINCTLMATKASILGVLLTFLCYDVPWSVGALRGFIEVISEEGTINNAVSPAPMSMASAMVTLSTQDMVADILAQMLLSSERYRGEAQASWTPGVYGGVVAGTRPDGSASIAMLLDGHGGGGGARTFADGIDSGGVLHSMASKISNVETVESRGSVIQLYRRQMCDGGGAGRFRGGVSLQYGLVPHKMESPSTVIAVAAGLTHPAGCGLAGGRPGGAISNLILRGTNVHEVMRSGRLPDSPESLVATRVDVLAAKALTTFGLDDVLIGTVAGGAGFGDPLRRNVELVIRDVADRLVSVTAARDVYGVVIEGDRADLEATRELRDAIRARRRTEGRPVESRGEPVPAGRAQGRLLHPVSDAVEAVASNGSALLRCSLCGTELSGYDEDFRRGALVHEIELAALTPANRHCRAGEFHALEFCCPGCGTALSVEVRRRGAPLRLANGFQPAAGVV
jgi:N-methylhydantoinase B